MNYYERHLGDYAKDTAHLTMLEHGAYALLLDRYYSTEQGIPANQVHRLARARTEEEKQAVDAVLEEFFTLEDGVWINNRAEEEIVKTSAKINAAKENGKKGGRPRRLDSGSENETHQKPTGFSVGSENETQQKAHQTPDTSNQEVLNDISGNSTSVDYGLIQKRAVEMTRLLRNAGASLQSADPRVIEWVTAGVSDKVLLAALDKAKRQREQTGSVQPIGAGLLNSIVQGMARAGPASEKFDPLRYVNAGYGLQGGENGTVIEANAERVA